MFETLTKVNWAEIPQPEWNSPTEVLDALRALLNVEDDGDAQNVYHRLLYAFGNDHRGTYYPVALWAIPFLGETLRNDNALVRETAFNVLLDLVGSFEPEPEFDRIHTAHGLELPLKVALRDAVYRLRPEIDVCASAVSTDSREHAIAKELLSLLG
jgi:hypothetical protein